MLNVAAMIHFFLLCEELFCDTVGLAWVHMESTLHFVKGVKADTRPLVHINA
jgi:hypothetical protein